MEPMVQQQANMEPMVQQQEHQDGAVLLPLFVDVGVRGHLAKAAAVCKRWAEVAAEVWPIIIERWNERLKDELSVAYVLNTTQYSSVRRMMKLVHRKSGTELEFAAELPRSSSNYENVVIDDDGNTCAQWKELKIVNSDGIKFRQQVVFKRRAIEIVWTGTRAKLTWAGEDAAQLVDRIPSLT